MNDEEDKYSWMFSHDRSYQLDLQKSNHDKSTQIPITEKLRMLYPSIVLIILIFSFTAIY